MVDRVRLAAKLLLCIVVVSAGVYAKPKVMAFGKWLRVRWMVGPKEDQPLEMKVRSLMVNGEVKEFTTGEPHDVTDRVFVVQRAYRLNDSLSADDEPRAKPEWTWRPGGWLLVQRGNASIRRLPLPDFDPYSSEAVWFRDYAAYCGIEDSGERAYAIVFQIGRRKPLLRKSLGAARMVDMPLSECESPSWQKNPPRVTFQSKGGQRITFEIRGSATEVPPESEED